MNAAPLPTLAQQRAARFVEDRIKETDTSGFHAGYIHGLIQALIMAGGLTVKQGGALEFKHECASCQAHNRKAVNNAPRRAVGGVA